MPATLDASQQAAVQLMASARFGLVTGGPGTGKTTTLAAALDVCDAAGESYELAAPTGKAARRMAQATGRPAQTIHRLLFYQGAAAGFAVTREGPLAVGAVFVDESSMIDYELARALMDGACNSRLIFIGDADQLPPVGVGRMFGDLIDARARVGGGIPMARLTHVHRQAAGSWVAVNAPRVLAGGPLDLDTCAGFTHVEVGAADQVVPAVLAAVAGDPHATVLSPQYAGQAGCDALNTALDPVLNRWSPRPDPGEPMLTRGDSTPIRVGMRVMQTRNHYKLDVMNGECGVVTVIDGARGPVTVDFGDDTIDEPVARIITFPRAESDDLTAAYALTVHKVQGSEFGRVIVVCHSTHHMMLSRSILYTAVTRAKQHVTLVGDAKGLARALRTDHARRDTTLIDRLTDTLDPQDP